MTPQEHQLLEDFLGRLQAAGGVAKDAEADALIRNRLAGQPDALYLLVQRSLLTDRALAEAQRQIQALQQQVAGAASGSGGGSFLGGAANPTLPEGFGRAPSQAFSPEPRPEQRGAEPPPAQAAGGWRNRWFGGGAGAAAQAAPAAASGPGFLGQAATTAAGVAGGMFLFNGIEHLINGSHANGGGNANSLFGGNDGGNLSGPMTENITENVFVQDSGGRDRQGFLDDGDAGNGDTWARNDDDGLDFGNGGDDDGNGFI